MRKLHSNCGLKIISITYVKYLKQQSGVWRVLYRTANENRNQKHAGWKFDFRHLKKENPPRVISGGGVTHKE
ncbi:hypothetical protein [Acinetobacter johnsonii]|uniref:hypothetical protein n=1 Tax=Acinetobacter johnsonii TaxID=40214 RepID=UPI0011E6142B|nr:hypothetical protein [Acinetobacter johnsonii]QEK34605.1 hypothetical protein FYN22_01335 [Acinetobacter johnsonii]